MNEKKYYLIDNYWKLENKTEFNVWKLSNKIDIK